MVIIVYFHEIKLFRTLNYGIPKQFRTFGLNYLVLEFRGDASSLDKGVHLISKGCTLAKFSQFFREIGSFLPFSGNLWGARAPSAPPLTAPLEMMNILRLQFFLVKKAAFELDVH